MSPTIAQIDEAARICRWRRLFTTGVMLASNGDFSRDAKLLDPGEKANLLSEEEELVEKAQVTVARR
jgi:hypothetical protein